MKSILELYREGDLRAALQETGEQLRTRPSDLKLRAFLFELLSFAGEWERAEKQLKVLAAQSSSAASGAVLLQGLLQAHRTREQVFEERRAAAPANNCFQPMVVNRIHFERCADEDDRICGLEIYASRGYEIVPWLEVQQLQTGKPATLRDLLWLPARLLRRNETEVQSVYLPSLAPGSWKHTNDSVRLGRTSVMEGLEEHDLVPFGVKYLLCDGEAISWLDLRNLEVNL